MTFPVLETASLLGTSKVTTDAVASQQAAISKASQEARQRALRLRNTSVEPRH